MSLQGKSHLTSLQPARDLHYALDYASCFCYNTLAFIKGGCTAVSCSPELFLPYHWVLAVATLISPHKNGRTVCAFFISKTINGHDVKRHSPIGEKTAFRTQNRNVTITAVKRSVDIKGGGYETFSGQVS